MCFHFVLREPVHAVHVLHRQLEQFGARTPVSWKINLSQIKFWWNTRIWNTSQFVKMLDLNSLEKKIFL